jgi:Caspase domain
MDRDLSRSRAILISNGIYRDLGIPDLPATAGCIPAMQALLTSDLCGWPPDRVESLPEVAAPHELARSLVELVKGAQDVLVLYYAGHGMRTATGQLALALGDSSADRELLPHTAILYEAVARILRRCSAATKLVILDCCHAELGNKDNYQTQSADIDAEPVDGLYCIWASKQWEKARSPLDGGLPYFTDAFIQVVRAGIPGKPPKLTIDQIFTELRARMLRADLPEPAQSGIRDAHHWPFARNAAPPETHRDPDRELALLTQRLAESEGLKAAADAQVLALQAELESLKVQASRADTAQEKREFNEAIDTAERLLEDTMADTAAWTDSPSSSPAAMNRSVTETLEVLADSLRKDDMTGIRGAVDRLKRHLASQERLADREACRQVIFGRGLLKDRLGLHPSARASVYRVLLKLAFDPPLTYASYCEIERAIGGRPGGALRSVLLKEFLFASFIPFILVAKAQPGFRDQELVVLLFKQGQGIQPTVPVDEVAGLADSIRPDHRVTVYDFAVRYLRDTAEDPWRELRRRGYLAETLEALFPGNIKEQRPRLQETLRLGYGERLSPDQVRDLFDHSGPHPTAALEDVARSMAASPRAVKLIAQQAAFARLSNAGYAEDALILKRGAVERSRWPIRKRTQALWRLSRPSGRHWSGGD